MTNLPATYLYVLVYAFESAAASEPPEGTILYVPTSVGALSRRVDPRKKSKLNPSRPSPSSRPVTIAEVFTVSPTATVMSSATTDKVFGAGKILIVIDSTVVSPSCQEIDAL